MVLDAAVSKHKITVLSHANRVPEQASVAFVTVSPVVSSLTLKPSQENIAPGNYFYLDLEAFVPKAFQTGKVTIMYPSDQVKLIRLSAHPDIKQQITGFDSNLGQVFFDNLSYLKGALNGSLAKFHFRAMKTGKVMFRLYNDGVFLDQKEVAIAPKGETQ